MPINFTTMKHRLVETGVQSLFFHLGKMCGQHHFTSYMFSKEMLDTGQVYLDVFYTKIPNKEIMLKPNGENNEHKLFGIISIDKVYKNPHVALFALVGAPIFMMYLSAYFTSFLFSLSVLQSGISCLKKGNYSAAGVAFINYELIGRTIPAICEEYIGSLGNAVASSSDVIGSAIKTIIAIGASRYSY